MFIRLARTPNVFFQSLRYTSRPTLPTIKHFSSLLNQTNSAEQISKELDVADELSSVNSHVNSYMKNLYKYLSIATVIGISSAKFFSITVPLGFPSAFLILAGLGYHTAGTEYIDKTKSRLLAFKGTDGNIQYSNLNSPRRKLAFLSSCLGYGCILGSLLGMIPLSPSVLPLSAITCLFSTLGHLGYCKFSSKTHFKPMQLFLSGLLTGIVGLNFITSGSTILMWENPLHLESLEVSSYLGLALFNIFAAHDSRKIIGEVHNGKGDHLKHASKFSENWLYSLIPHFLMNMQ